jgi:Family of unknown function (DUF6492)
MTELAVITPCYRGDVALFRELHRSVLEFTPADTVHHVFVPPQDKHLFTEFAGPRCQVTVRSGLLPRHYVRLPKEIYVNLKHPWPALRPWVMQQTVKIAATSELDADVVLVADSDAVFIRPVTADRFRAGDGCMLLHREERAVKPEMTRHVLWHQVARDLLGLPPSPPPPLPDYVTPLNYWDPTVVRAMQQRIAETTGRDWMDAFNAQLHISEFILYGVFVDEVLSATKRHPDDGGVVCANYYDRVPMDDDRAIAFADSLAAETVAIMISSHSGTPEQVRQTAIARCAENLAAGRA